ncbi:hypothetical protein RSAG8_00011, partial [Rhizoctonia solani AG-8 WAC10335]
MYKFGAFDSIDLVQNDTRQVIVAQLSLSPTCPEKSSPDSCLFLREGLDIDDIILPDFIPRSFSR